MEYLAIIYNYFVTIIGFFDKHTWIPTFFTIISAVYIAFMQLNRQRQNTLDSQRANMLDELHVQIYKEIVEKIGACESALSNSDSKVRVLPYAFEDKIQEDINARKMGLSETSLKISERFPALHARHGEAMGKVMEVMSVMDKYEIAFTDFTALRQHIFNKYVEANEVMSAFNRFVMDFLPMDIKEEERESVGGAKVMNRPTPDPKALERIWDLSKSATDESMSLAAYLHDLRIETQNALLSPIFNNTKAPKRVTSDPYRYPVLSRDNNPKAVEK